MNKGKTRVNRAAGPSVTAVRILALVLSVLAVTAVVAGCGKNDEEARLQKEREWALYNFSEGVTPPPKPKPLPKDIVVELPDSVKAKYTSVVMAVGNRKTKDIKKFTVKVGSTAKVPGTDYTIEVGAFVPTWIMSGNVVKTRKEEPDDPAVRATIYKSGEKVFDGFIFQRYKTPSFITDEYVIGLVGPATK